MKQIVIETPVVNSAFAEPVRHFQFNDDGISDEIVEERRTSSYFIPIAQPKKKGKEAQQTFDGWTADRIFESKTVNATLFPWVVSDFSLIDAIESGIVKVPRVPVPDFLIRIDDGHGGDNPLNLTVEVSGQPNKEKEAKVTTARSLWVPAVNNGGAWVRWACIDISDPWNAMRTIRASLPLMRKG